MIPPLAALGAADRWLLLKINREWTAPLLDKVMPVITDIHKVPWFLYGVGPAMLGLWLWKGRKQALKVLVVAVLAMGAGDLIAHRVLKPWAARPRPERTLGGQVTMRAPANGAYGFPSNHAINMGAAASVLTYAYPGGALLFAGAAALVAYSRVYVGAHYPIDVLAGLILGVGIGWPWAALMLGGASGSAAKKKRK
ncbi:MAG: phosphatase PAP2 family protein [Elusimicrobiota bacterium]